jgi:hypothetical protein
MGQPARPAVLIIRKDLDTEEEEHVRRQRMLGAHASPSVPIASPPSHARTRLATVEAHGACRGWALSPLCIFPPLIAVRTTVLLRPSPQGPTGPSEPAAVGSCTTNRTSPSTGPHGPSSCHLAAPLQWLPPPKSFSCHMPASAPTPTPTPAPTPTPMPTPTPTGEEEGEEGRWLCQPLGRQMGRRRCCRCSNPSWRSDNP